MVPLNTGDVRCRRMSSVGHPGQAGAQLSPCTGTAQQVMLLPWAPDWWLCLQEPRMSHPCCHQLLGSSQVALWDMCKEVFMLGVFCPWEPALNVPSMLGMSRDRTCPAAEAAGPVFEVAMGLSTFAGVRCGAANTPQWFLGGFCVCLLLKWLWLRSCWVRRLCALVWHCMAYGLLLKANWEVRGSCHTHGSFMKTWPPAWPLICKIQIPHCGSIGCLFTHLKKQRSKECSKLNNTQVYFALLH